MLLDRRPALGSLDRDLATHSLLAISERAAALMIEEPERYDPDRFVAFAEGVLSALWE